MTIRSSEILSPNLTHALLRWINRGLEALWLLLVVLVPLAFIDRDYAVSEAVIAYVEVPKIALLRTIAGLMAILCLVQWAVHGTFSQESTLQSIRSKLRPYLWLAITAGWLKRNPSRIVVMAVWIFLGSTLLSTVLSGALETSLWGEIPGQDGYSTYNVLAYIIGFGVIATHLKTRPQINI